MQSLIYHPFPTPHTTIHTLPIPSPGRGDLLIHISHAASNPKDHAHPTAQHQSLNSGDDMSGVIVSLGSTVTSPSRFHPGDRVAAFHRMGTPYGTYAEYAIAPEHTTVKIPGWMGWEDAATVPLVAFTAAVTVWRRLGFRAPWEEEEGVQGLNEALGGGSGMEKGKGKGPLIVYGAGSALGGFVIQLAKAGGVGPIVAVAGGSGGHVAGLLDLGGEEGGDVLLDYRGNGEDWIAAARKALSKVDAKHAVDCISHGGTWVPLAELVGKGGVVSVVNGGEKYEEPEVERSGAKVVYTFVGTVHEGAYKSGMPKQPPREEAEGDVAFAEKFAIWLEQALESGQVKPHPWTKIDGGLQGVDEGLRRLRSGEAKSSKVVYDIGGKSFDAIQEMDIEKRK